MTREEILEGLYEIKNWKCNGDAKTHEVVAEAIKALELESRKGHWKAHGRGYEKIYMCDNCKKESLQRGNYCPNCGADMREVVEDGNGVPEVRI